MNRRFYSVLIAIFSISTIAMVACGPPRGGDDGDDEDEKQNVVCNPKCPRGETCQKLQNGGTTCVDSNNSGGTGGLGGLTSGGSTSGSTTSGSTTGGSGGGGGASCDQILVCMGNCPQNDQQCMDNCYKMGSTETNEKVDDLLTCGHNKCPNTSTDTCTCNNCVPELRACNLYSACSSGGSSSGGTTGSSGGTKTCGEVAECWSNCSTDACEDDCIAQGTQQAQSAFFSWETCLIVECSNASDPQACVCQKCASETNACVPGSC